HLTIARSEGEGALYYTTYLNLRLFADEVKAISRGITVSREYYLADDPETPITSATVGDLINVRVNFSLPHDVYYFVLEDPIPAGTETVNKRLLTSSAFTSGEQFIRHREDEYWNWGWWHIDRTELRD